MNITLGLDKKLYIYLQKQDEVVEDTQKKVSKTVEKTDG